MTAWARRHVRALVAFAVCTPLLATTAVAATAPPPPTGLTAVSPTRVAPALSWNSACLPSRAGEQRPGPAPDGRCAVGGCPHHGRSLPDARSRRPRQGHPGDRQGGVPRRAHRRRGARGGARPRSGGRALRDPGLRAHPGHARRAGGALAVLHASAASWSAAREPARRVGRRPARLRRAPAEDVALVLVHGGGAKGSGVLAKLRKLGPVTEVEVGRAQAVGVPGVRRGRGAPPRRDGSTARRPTCWCRRSARTCARSRRRPTSSPTTSRARR